MNLLKTTTITSSLVAVSLLGSAGLAQAQTATVPFEVTVTPLCIFDTASITAGVLILNPVDNTQLITDTPGSVPITCNNNVLLSVAAPQAVIVQTATPTVEATATLLAGSTTSGGAATTVTGPFLNTPVDVTMTATGAAPLADGFYSYQVDVTAVAQ